VGIPFSISAKMIARGQAEKKGIAPPERAFSSRPYFAELARRDMGVHEEIVKIGTP
jgi:lysine 6-dehydrogenase